jgi:predicted metalloenzyme YecM
MISWRPICVYELYEPIQFANQQISIVEFMYPKEWATKWWWDHIEVVLWEYTPDLKEIEKRITGLSWLILTADNGRYSIKRNEGIVSGQRPNPAITLQFQESAIRFHSISLKELLTH